MSALPAEPEQLNLLLPPGRKIPGVPPTRRRCVTEAERIADECDDTIRGWQNDRYGRREPLIQGDAR